MRLIPLCVLLMSAAAPALPAQEGAKTKFEWKLKKGDQLRYEAGQTMEMDFGGTEITVEMLFGLALEVSEVSGDGVAKMKSTYDRVKMAVSGPMTADFDSETGKKPDENDVLGLILSNLHNKSFTMDLSRKGECVKVEGHSKILEDAIKDVPEDIPMAAQISGNLKKEFGDETIKAQFQTLFGFLPKDPVASGDSWPLKHGLANTFGKLAFDGNTSLKEVRSEGKEAVLKTEAKVTVTPSADGDIFGAMEIDASKYKAETVFLIEEGRVETSQGTITLDGTAGGMEFSIVQKTKLKWAPKKK
jgi:hypothetical protein